MAHNSLGFELVQWLVQWFASTVPFRLAYEARIAALQVEDDVDRRRPFLVGLPGASRDLPARGT